MMKVFTEFKANHLWQIGSYRRPSNIADNAKNIKMKNVIQVCVITSKLTWLKRAANQEALQLTCFSYVSLMIGFNLVFILPCFLTYFVSYKKMTLMPKLSFSSRES